MAAHSGNVHTATLVLIGLYTNYNILILYSISAKSIPLDATKFYTLFFNHIQLLIFVAICFILFVFLVILCNNMSRFELSELKLSVC